MENTPLFTHKQAMADSLEYFGGNELAASAFVGKYALKDNDKNFKETNPDQMHRRLAKEFARVEAKYPNPMSEEEVYQLLKNFKKIIPQGSPMMGIGNPYQVVSLGNCFVVPNVLDSIGGIAYTDQQLANLFKRRCGVGVDVSNLRPKDVSVKNAAGSTSGIATFMEKFSNTCRGIGQCIAEGERVLTQTGMKRIEEVVPGTDKVWTKIGWVGVNNLLANGKKEVFELTTARGYKVKTSKDHIFLDGTTLEEKTLADFEPGDSVCLLLGTQAQKKTPVTLTAVEVKNTNGQLNENITQPTVLSESLAYLIGYAYGDGCVSRNKYGEPVTLELACSNDWPLVKEKLALALSENFGIVAKFSSGDGNLERIRVGSKVICTFLQKNGLLKEKADSLVFPNQISEGPTSVWASFVAGFFDADGYASGKKKGYVFSSIQRSFLEEIQTGLLSLGIATRLHAEDRTKNGWNTLYNINVTGTSSQKRFVELFSGCSVKVAKSMHVSLRDNLATPWLAKEFGIKTANYSFLNGDQRMSVSSYQKYLEASAREAMPQPMFTDEVVSVELVGTMPTYDLSLPKEHMFWCEGFYVHNSGRRGALMLTISCHHPEIRTFINIKRNLEKVTGANISIRWSDEFMQAVDSNAKVQLRWPVESATPTISTMVDAKEIWDEFVEAAWECAEPGCLFWDTILKNSPADVYAAYGFKTISCNPCSEITMGPDSCRLLLINAFGYVKDAFSKKASFDFEAFCKDSAIAQRLMDDIVDLELECIDKILAKVEADPEPAFIKQGEYDMWSMFRNTAIAGRRTGLGLTAVGDVIAALGMIYGESESIEFINQLYKQLELASHRASVDLAEERGAFPIWNKDLEKDNEFLMKVLKEDSKTYEKYLRVGRRNIANTTTPPAGTTSLLACLSEEQKLFGTTSGIEPAYLISYKRRKKINPNDKEFRVDFVDDMGDKWQEYEVFHPGYKMWQQVREVEWETEGRQTYFDPKPENSPYWKSTSADVNWKASVDLQAAAQEWIDHAISKTCNLPTAATKELVSDVYLRAWKSGCKGFTIYRDGSRSGVLVASSEGKKDAESESGFQQHSAPKRPKEIPCDIYHSTVAGEKWTIFVGLLEGKPYEIMGGLAKYVKIPRRVTTGKLLKYNGEINPARYDLHYGFEKDPDDETIIQDVGNVFENPTNSGFTRVLSLALRHGAPVQYAVEQLTKGGDKESDLFSITKAFTRVLKNYVKDGTKTTAVKKCPDCGSKNLAYKDGCVQCMDCGSSKCG